jgi:hypothetical protein
MLPTQPDSPMIQPQDANKIANLNDFESSAKKTLVNKEAGTTVYNFANEKAACSKS